ncbi:serine-rich adhesin for platelets-like isoform X2 [Clytia hemisphaerica]|uniref:serine-rich adhesin for platelets-like isoform X2 n=1 Tax=Clytia hemisphaerica TaxID=252671 RepID=UPI0034D5392E
MYSVLVWTLKGNEELKPALVEVMKSNDIVSINGKVFYKHQGCQYEGREESYFETRQQALKRAEVVKGIESLKCDSRPKRRLIPKRFLEEGEEEEAEEQQEEELQNAVVLCEIDVTTPQKKKKKRIANTQKAKKQTQKASKPSKKVDQNQDGLSRLVKTIHPEKVVEECTFSDILKTINPSINDLSTSTGVTNRNTSTLTGATNRDTSTLTGATNHATSPSTGGTNHATSPSTGATNRDTSTPTGAMNRDTSTSTGAMNYNTSTLTGAMSRNEKHNDLSTSIGATNRDSSTSTGATNHDSSTSTGATNHDSSTSTGAMNRDTSTSTGAMNYNTSTLTGAMRRNEKQRDTSTLTGAMSHDTSTWTGAMSHNEKQDTSFTFSSDEDENDENVPVASAAMNKLPGGSPDIINKFKSRLQSKELFQKKTSASSCDECEKKTQEINKLRGLLAQIHGLAGNHDRPSQNSPTASPIPFNNSLVSTSNITPQRAISLIPLVKEETLLVPKLEFFNMKSDALTKHNPGKYLLNELIKLVFTVDELASHKATHSRSVKSQRPGLDETKCNTIRAFINKFTGENCPTKPLSSEEMRKVFESQIGAARKKKKNSLVPYVPSSE